MFWDTVHKKIGLPSSPFRVSSQTGKIHLYINCKTKPLSLSLAGLQEEIWCSLDLFPLNSFFIYFSRPGIQNLELDIRIFFKGAYICSINEYMKISKTHKRLLAQKSVRPTLIQIVQNQTIDYTTLLNAPKSCKMINCVARGEMECRLRSGLLTWPQPALRNPTVEPLEPQQAPLCSRMRCCDTGPGRFWGVRILSDFLLSFF